eukprot:TRINITY_DN9890_c0_g1_i1.p1 TRINITY_DN9890_c0_g1~~TRINITY_DN9890_c0_g1_i1.p1  ORF type:complete len:550 (+),score=154.60 TRINITY_DN9890_c0_g1_i1:139-1788(+)
MATLMKGVHGARPQMFNGHYPVLRQQYRASRDGWRHEIFHKLCDDLGPSLTVTTLPSGAALCAYTRKSWRHRNNLIQDNDSFIARLEADGRVTKFRALPSAGAAHQFAANTIGPVFGSSNTLRLDLEGQSSYVKAGGGFAGPDGVTPVTVADLLAGQDSANPLPRTDVYVFSVWEVETPPWRAPVLAEELRRLRAFSPGTALGLTNVNMLLAGEKGTTKSSYTNAVCSGVAGRIVRIAEAHPSSDHVTSRLSSYSVARGVPVEVRDMYGRTQHYDAETTLAMDGRLKEGSSWSAEAVPREGDPRVRKNPRFGDETHCVLATIAYPFSNPAAFPEPMQHLKTLVERARMYPRCLPVVVLLTQADEAEDVLEDLSNVYGSVQVLAARQRVADAVGLDLDVVLPVSTPFGVRRSESEEMVENSEALCLRALCTALDRCSDFLLNVEEGRVVRKNVQRARAQPPRVSAMENGVMGRDAISYDVVFSGSVHDQPVELVLEYKGRTFRGTVDACEEDVRACKTVTFLPAPDLTVMCVVSRECAGLSQIVELHPDM